MEIGLKRNNTSADYLDSIATEKVSIMDMRALQVWERVVVDTKLFGFHIQNVWRRF